MFFCFYLFRKYKVYPLIFLKVQFPSFGILGKERKGKERKGKERKGKERKGKERKGKERKGKERTLL
jgi:hypothetical protein